MFIKGFHDEMRSEHHNAINCIVVEKRMFLQKRWS